jgi:hypothetical protein
MFADAAAFYVGLGRKIFPLAPGSKAPLIPKAEGGRGVHDATDDAEVIAAWAARCPEANIGIACGEPSGLLVVDCDPRNGSEATLKRLAAKRFLLPPTAEVETQSGGRHHYYSHPGLPPGWKRTLGDGIDIQTTGKYVVAPPSRIQDGGIYRWLRSPLGPNLPPPPRWLLEMLKPPPVRSPGRLRGHNAQGETERRFEGAVRKVASAPKRTRNNELNKMAHLAGVLIATEGLDEEHAINRLMAAGAAAGLEPAEIPRTIASGIRAGQRRARQQKSV